MRSLILPLIFAPMFSWSAPLPRLHPNSVFNQNISAAPLHPASQAMLDQLTALGGFGKNRLQIYLSFHVLYADAQTPTITTTSIPGPGNAYYAPNGGLGHAIRFILPNPRIP